MKYPESYSSKDITAVILAGGRGRRLEGKDKGLLPVHGKAMIEYAIAAIKPQVSHILISANRNEQAYARFGYPVINDTMGDYYGPLAGVVSALENTKTELLVTVPCDCPQLPNDLVPRLFAALQTNSTRASIAHDGERLQPMFALLYRNLLPALKAYIETGERKADNWYRQQNATIADFSEFPEAFMNINTEQDLMLFGSTLNTLNTPNIPNKAQ
ncbi:MAG: molybdenum cofactor guanylyltransferase MobA [Gammaproteobacteria bacterium]|jgi:molybdenum cofactor guanylyltransferase